MIGARDNTFILVGSKPKGGTFYVCRPGRDRNVWMAYDMAPGGELSNPRVVFGAGGDASWRGLPELG